MSERVAVIGAGPLPIYSGQSSMGPGIRTWQLAKPLARHGHEVFLVTFEFAIGDDWDFDAPRYEVDLAAMGAVQHLSLPEPLPGDYEALIEKVRGRLDRFQPGVIVSAGAFFASRVAVSLNAEQPLWIDLFGNTMSEVQAKVARSEGNDSEFFRFLYRTELALLRRGDHFSALSTPQKMAVIGQLAMAGRINDKNFEQDLVDVIPCGFDGETAMEPRRRVLRDVHVDADAFVVLWTGGFNSWVDERTLFEGVTRAMEQDASLHWVSLGGGIRGHFQEGYRWFREQVEACPWRKRFLFLDWIPTDQVTDYYFESDLGINVDLPIYEALLGGRNRIVAWMAAGLPTLTTETTEISKLLREQEMGFTVPVKRPDLLADRLGKLSAERDRLPAVGRKARAYATHYLTFEATASPLLSWVENPHPAPDRAFLLKHGRGQRNSLEDTLDELSGLLERPSPRDSQSWLRRIARRARGKN